MRAKPVIIATLLTLASVLVAPASPAAVTCPPGQSGSPPYCAATTITVTATRATNDAVTLRVTLSAPGRVKVAGEGVKSRNVVCLNPWGASGRPAAAGRGCTGALSVRLTAKEKRLLRRVRRDRVELTVTYTPLGGGPTVRTVTVELRSHG